VQDTGQHEWVGVFALQDITAAQQQCASVGAAAAALRSADAGSSAVWLVPQQRVATVVGRSVSRWVGKPAAGSCLGYIAGAVVCCGIQTTAGSGCHELKVVHV